MQKLIIDSYLSSFNKTVQEYLSKGYKVVPGTMVIALDTTKERVCGNCYAVVVEEVVKSSQPVGYQPL